MLENPGSFWAGIVIGLVIGGLVVLGSMLWRQRREEQAGRSVRALERAHQAFRDDVNHHFVETAELINRLTDSYKAVFDHLAEGADRLVEDRVVQEKMPKVGDHEVRIQHIGHRVRIQGKEDK